MSFHKTGMRFVPLACLLFGANLANASILLDRFDYFQTAGVAPTNSSTATVAATFCPGDPVAECVPGANPLVGGTREFLVERSTSTTGSRDVVSLTSYSGGTESLFYSTGANVRGRGMVTWDGGGAVASAYGQLANKFDVIDLDFSADNVYKISMAVQTELGVTLTLRFYGDLVLGQPSYTVQTKVIGGMPNVTQNVSFYLVDFVPVNGTNGSIFSQVRAYQLLIDSFDAPRANSDASITLFEATTVPEPATLAIVGLSLVGLASAARKRTKI